MSRDANWPSSDTPRSTRMASLLKAGFDSNQPRDEGGRWTDAGGGRTGSGDGTAGNTPPSRPLVQVASATPDRTWEYHPNPEFRQGIAEAERSAEHANHGYEQRNRTSNALERYQMTEIALGAAGMKTPDKRWTGKYGIRSDQEFLADPEAQELALSDYLADNDRQLLHNGSKSFIGRSIAGKEENFIITEAGLAGAAHRHGAPTVRQYLAHQQRTGWRSDFSSLTEKQRKTFAQVESRMRTFRNKPFRVRR